MTFFENLKFRTKLFAGYTIILILMFLLATVVYTSLNGLSRDRKWVNHTHEAIQFAQQCGALLVDMETGVRGFLVAGKDLFLEPYNKGLETFDSAWKSGREHTIDNPSQTQRWDDLKRKKNIWINTIAKPEIAMRRQVREGELATRAFEKISSESTGKQIFDQLRNHLDLLKNKFSHTGDDTGEQLITQITIDLLNQETGQRGFLLTGNEASLDPFIQGLADFNTHFDELGKLNLEGKGIRIDEILRIRTLMEKWHEKAAMPQIESRREVNKYPIKLSKVTAMLESGAGKRLMDEMREIIHEMISEERELLFSRTRSMERASKITISITVIGALSALVFGIVVCFFIVRTLSRQLGTEPALLEQISQKIAKGDLRMELADDRENASGVYLATIDMVENLRAAIDQAKKVSQGHFDQKIGIRSERDQLGMALVKMTQSLKDSAQKAELEQIKQAGQATINERLQGEKNLETITDITIRFLSEYHEAQVGAFYLLNPDDRLDLSATYAYQKRKNLSDSFKIGEGLVGQAAREMKPIIVSDIPEDYIHVTSGLGNTSPACILVYPISFEGSLKGVVELASTQMLSDVQIDFLDSVEQSIAVAIQSAESRDQMASLLEQTQQQAEDLQSQQEELREANEILETQKKALIQSETQLQNQQEELRQTNEELEEQTQLLEEQKSSIENKNTELEKTRQIIEQKAKDLELTSKYKSEFLANMSHELRTPLNSILLLSRLLSDNKEQSLTPKQQEYSKTIHLSGTELLNLINEILDLSKVESGKMEVHPEQIYLSEMIKRFERTFAPQAQNKNLQFITHLDDSVPDQMKTDSQRLEQIIKNLISNALKFTDKGSIRMGIKRPKPGIDLSVFNLDPDKTIAISVTDTGEGIAPDKQKLVFEAFQQADGTTSRKYGGSGLGLSISRELSKLLGGVILLDSEAGKGSTFTLYLPEILEKEFVKKQSEKAVKQSPETQKAPEVKEVPAAEISLSDSFIPDDRNNLHPEDKTILIVEDDSKFAKTLSDLARERGYKVLVAGDGETGLHFADYYIPNAIILDIGLPGMDGWSVMDRLKEQPKTRHIPVHFISAHDESVEARKMGAIGFITKPVTISLLDDAFQKIEHLISGDIKKLLVVEDNEIQRKAMLELIGNGDVQVTEAANGEQAFELIRKNEFDCIILDLGLPDVSGVQLLTRMKDNEAVTKIPIIVYTGKELTPEEEGMIDEYAEKIIIKGARSAEKLVDETALFLHRVEADLPEEKRKMIRVLHDRESVFAGKKILVVDDDMRNVYAISNVLEEKGLEMLAAENGKKCLEVIDKHPDVNLVLMDIMMPEMDGYEAMRTIRQDNRFKELPIIALTAKAMKGDRVKCIESGASDYLAKPVNTDKLLSMMRVWLY